MKVSCDFQNKRFSMLPLWLMMVSIAAIFAAPLQANELSLQLTEEQRTLLYGQHVTPGTDFSFNTPVDAFDTTIALMRFQLTATTDPMKGNRVELGATYRSVALSTDFSGLQFHTYETGISIHGPLQRALDFSASIRDKVELCPEKMLDKLIVDGAVAFNFSW